jgi:hypothetical protein
MSIFFQSAVLEYSIRRAVMVTLDDGGARHVRGISHVMSGVRFIETLKSFKRQVYCVTGDG